MVLLAIGPLYPKTHQSKSSSEAEREALQHFGPAPLDPRGLDEQQLRAEFILHDRDTKFSFAFDKLLRSAGIVPIRTPLLAPNANAFVESWIGSFKRECLNHFMCFGLGHLDHIKREYADFHNTHRPHQGLGNRTVPEAATGPPVHALDSTGPPVEPVNAVLKDSNDICCRRFLGGLLRHYYRRAA